MNFSTSGESSGARRRVLGLSTFAFTALFAVWLMLGVLGLAIKTDTQLMLGDAARTMTVAEQRAAVASRFEWLLAVAILSGSVFRLNFGIWADRYGGRNVMIMLLLFCAVPTYCLGRVHNYAGLLICAALFGLAGNSFTVGVAWNSAWFPAKSKGTALGVFGAGNVGASGTKLLVVLAPGILTLIPAAGYAGGLIPGGWRFVPTLYAGLLLLTAALVALAAPRCDPRPAKGRPLAETLAPLRSVRVWRFSLYYVVVFGAYVALSAWLPNYFQTVYGVGLQSAALLTALFIIPASLLRPLGGWLSDRFGPRVVTYAVFVGMTIITLPLCLPKSILQLDVVTFATLLFLIGVGMGIGKASVYKYIPNYFPNDVGAVGGLVGALGALGGFALPPVFGWLGRATGSPQAAFYALLALTLGSLAWLHLTVVRLKAAEPPARTHAEPALERV
jgi:NNP family nitrate/nitrite transporter-like MFS transporter